MTKEDIINAYIAERKYRRYLSVGAGAHSGFDQVRCEYRRSVDPDARNGATDIMTSDTFFRGASAAGMRFDLVLIDGLHSCEQCYKDIQNAISVLAPDGVVIVHDCLPADARVASEKPVRGNWCGDVYRAVCRYFAESPYRCFVVDADWGCGVIDTQADTSSSRQFPYARMQDLSYDEFSARRSDLVEVVSPSSFSAAGRTAGSGALDSRKTQDDNGVPAAGPVRWRAHIDRAYVIPYLPQGDRLPRLADEMRRVGLSGSGLLEWRYTTPSPFDRLVFDGFRGKAVSRPVYVNQLLEVQRIFSEALAFGYRRIMVMESDIAFLRDLGRLDAILSDIPDGFDFIQLDKFVRPGDARAYGAAVMDRRINASFFDITGTQYVGAGCNIYTAAGMRAFLTAIQTHLPVYDRIYEHTGLRGACAVANAAVQVLYASAINLTFKMGTSGIHEMYLSQGIDYGDYAVPDGYTPNSVYEETRPFIGFRPQ